MSSDSEDYYYKINNDNNSSRKKRKEIDEDRLKKSKRHHDETDSRKDNDYSKEKHREKIKDYEKEIYNRYKKNKYNDYEERERKNYYDRRSIESHKSSHSKSYEKKKYYEKDKYESKKSEREKKRHKKDEDESDEYERYEELKYNKRKNDEKIKKKEKKNHHYTSSSDESYRKKEKHRDKKRSHGRSRSNVMDNDTDRDSESKPSNKDKEKVSEQEVKDESKDEIKNEAPNETTNEIKSGFKIVDTTKPIVETKNLSRLERLKLFAQKLKWGSNENVKKVTKFTLNASKTKGVNKQVNLDIFMENDIEEEEEEDEKKKNLVDTRIEREVEIEEDMLKEEAEENGDDPLEIFMKNIEKENLENQEIYTNKTITLDEIYSYDINKHKYEDAICAPVGNGEKNDETMNGNSQINKPELENDKGGNEGNDEMDDEANEKEEDDFYKMFIETLKKKTEEDKKKKEEEEEKERIKNEEKEQNELDDSSINLSEDSEYNCETNTLKKKINKKLLQVNHDEIDYLPIKKNVYVQVSEITNMTEKDVEMFRKNNGNIVVRGKNCPRPIQYFYQCGLPGKILNILEKKNFKKMFSIQMQAIPALMCGRDIIAIAETGSGKTISYLFPLIRHVLHQDKLRNNDGPIGIILTPTRELSIQVKNEASIYCKAVDLKILAVYGGSNIGAQLNVLKKGVEIIVGTPGRIIDILTISNSKVTNLNRASFIVLDEADRLLDLGFESQIHSILNNCRKDKQTAMISATFPNYIQNLAKKLLYKPIEIIVGEKGKTNNNIYQFVEVLEEQKKLFRLLKLLGEWIKYGLILIFVNKQLEADLLYLELFKYEYKTLVLHGGQDQSDREHTLKSFKDEQNKILIATSVMARGIDIKNIILVINYECPDHIEDYIHKIGRTGRSNNIGYAYTFITPTEHTKAYDIYNLIKNNIYYINKTIDIPIELEQMVNEYMNSKIAAKDGNKLNPSNGASNSATTNSIAYHGGDKKKGYKGKGFKFTPNEKSRMQMDKDLAKKELGLVEEKNEDEDREAGYTSDMENEGKINSNTINKTENIAQTHEGKKMKNMAGTSKTQKNNETNISPQANLKQIELEIQRIKMDDTMNLSLKAKKINELMKAHNFIELQQNSYKTVDSTNDEEIDKMAEMESLKLTEHIKDPKEKQLMFQKTKEDIKKKLINNKAQIESRNESIQRNMLLNAIRTKNMKKYSPFLPHTYVTEDNTILEEFYINDYPQHVRLKISNRDVLARIQDMSGAMCQIKGQYSNPSQPNKTNFILDHKLLHIEITAPTYNQVQIARTELTSLLNMFMQKCNIKNQKPSAGGYATFR
ncbi:adenosinetriphosphatase [Plasmodium vinckei petteri]|uniref:RNA helicase n=1 Tax=Plasmodium vinckei petteri TaxID=138298 RepID=W7B5H2_PLAVN|nr:adenosinetriphosphatase [Plasmodium vinckei petteri]CAD2108252.1 pre-mRNA-processing ATP-dependent RNA helicase PRP5, putative [Plasmodium vinckei petteri]